MKPSAYHVRVPCGREVKNGIHSDTASMINIHEADGHKIADSSARSICPCGETSTGLLSEKTMWPLLGINLSLTRKSA